MLLPDQRIRRGFEKIIPMFSSEGTKFDEIAFQMWLKLEWHAKSESHLNTQSTQ
jgi:hypothetical protein